MSTTTQKARLARRRRIRAKVRGTTACPRLAFFRSNKHIYAQIIDDSVRKTLASVSSLTGVGEVRGAVAQAEILGEALAKAAKEKGIEKVVFDRGGFVYTGSVRAFADAARRGGLLF